jgi:hypothetical protein
MLYKKIISLFADEIEPLWNKIALTSKLICFFPNRIFFSSQFIFNKFFNSGKINPLKDKSILFG